MLTVTPATASSTSIEELPAEANRVAVNAPPVTVPPEMSASATIAALTEAAITATESPAPTAARTVLMRPVTTLV